MPIILADAEKDYLACLSNRLSHVVPENQLFLCTQTEEIVKTIGNSPDPILLIYSPVDFADFRIEEIGKSRYIECWPLINGHKIALSDQPAFRRIGSTTELVCQLRQWVLKSMMTCSDNQIESARSGTTENLPPVNLLCCLEAAGFKPGYSRKMLKRLLLIYDRVIYLPLMPTFQMSCIVKPDNGFTLSHLLLRLTVNDVSAQDLGLYLQPNPDGYMQFRPPDRSDDLVTCSPETMRQLVQLIRKYINNVTTSCAIVIECAGLPFSTLHAVAVLCDSCQILLPDKDCFATTAARHEASRLMAELPSSCKIIS